MLAEVARLLLRHYYQREPLSGDRTLAVYV
jgi:hypothetical protein